VARQYGQYCGLAKALDLVGGRWSLLIVRELLTGAQRFTDLQQNLPGIPTNILSSRLRELEETGLIKRTVQPRPSSGVAYELTPYGLELEEPVLILGLWGSKSLGRPTSGDVFSTGALAIALKAAFHPEEAHDLAFEIRLDGQRVHGAVREGRVSFSPDPQPEPRLVLETVPEVFSELFRGDVDVDAAVASGRAHLRGSKAQARRFFEMFRLPAREPTAIG
jgi:DNA-binding HxlR family transcriptional regulator